MLPELVEVPAGRRCDRTCKYKVRRTQIANSRTQIRNQGRTTRHRTVRVKIQHSLVRRIRKGEETSSCRIAQGFSLRRFQSGISSLSENH